MVRLPHRSHGMEHRCLLLRSPASEGERRPETGPEVSATEDGIGSQPREEHQRA